MSRVTVPPWAGCVCIVPSRSQGPLDIPTATVLVHACLDQPLQQDVHLIKNTMCNVVGDVYAV